MNADIAGALAQLDKSYKAFVHNGKRMTKDEVRQVLEYGKEKGYEHTGQLTDEEVDQVLSGAKTEENPAPPQADTLFDQK
jgi:hypothetical protein